MAQEFVNAQIKDNKVVVFSKTWCPYCTMAKNAFKEVGLKDYKLIELDSHDMADEIQNYLQSLTGARSVPRVFIGGKCIGGGSETKAMKSNGQLEKTLKEIGAL